MPKKFKHDPKWAKAKRCCRLNMEDIAMAKELGLSPKTLMKNNPSPTQKWKLPMKEWIRELHWKRFGEKKRAAVAVDPIAEVNRELRAIQRIENEDVDIPF